MKSSEKLFIEIRRQSTLIHDHASFKEKLMMPLKEAIPHSAAGITGVRGSGFDLSGIHYGYPQQFLVDSGNLIPEEYKYWQKYIVNGKEVGYHTDSSGSHENFYFSDVFKNRYMPYGISDVLQTMYFDRNGDKLGLTGYARFDGKPYNNEEIELFNKLSPYLFFAYRRYRWLLENEFFTTDSPDELLYGIIAVDKNKKIIYSNVSANDCLKKMEGKLTTYLPAALSAVYSDCLDNYGATKKHNLLFQYIDTICPWGSTICFCVDKEVAHLPQAKDAAAIIVIDTKTIDSKKCSQVTKREKEVLHCLTKGMQDKEIASTLGIAEKTVHAHVRNILSKLDAKNRTEAANMAIRLKLT